MTEVSRRAFLGRAGLAAGGVAGPAGLGFGTRPVRAAPGSAAVRAFVLASPPRQVTDAINGHRAGLDADTNDYLNTQHHRGLGMVYNGIRDHHIGDPRGGADLGALGHWCNAAGG